MNDLEKRLKISTKISYEELVELAYETQEKLEELKSETDVLDKKEVEYVTNSIKKINHEFGTNLSEELREHNKDLFEKRRENILTYAPQLIKLSEKNSQERLDIIDYFIKLNNSLISDISNFKEELSNNLVSGEIQNSNEDVICENCGSKNLANVDGIATCQSCGAKYPNMSLGKISVDEGLKEKEIRRLIELNREDPDSRHEPTTGILNDEEILKYTPKSIAASEIRFKRGEASVDDKWVHYEGILLILLIIVFGGGPIFGALAFSIFSIEIAVTILSLIIVLPILGMIYISYIK
ncbi:MAG: hypothetical protein LBM26_05530 [Methanobrevibacter sp.]|jgi:ribosomal protein L37AE/L43A|nr:hypothetical protein [Methanobrevibacter sp.]